MKQIYIKRKGDSEIITDYKIRFKKAMLEELVDNYNAEVKCGIVGVHRQALYLIALRQEFRERLKESPVFLQEYVLSLAGKIELVNNQIWLII